MNVTSIIDRTKTLNVGKLRNRPPGIKNIDEDDRNPFLLAAYAMDIYEYLRYLEVIIGVLLIERNYTRFYVNCCFQETHPIKEDYLKGREVTPKVRAVLIDWLVEVQQEYHLLQETLHITVAILDTYLQVINENIEYEV